MSNEINTGNSEPEQNSVEQSNITTNEFIAQRTQQMSGQPEAAQEEVGNSAPTEASAEENVLSNMDLDNMSDAELQEISQKLGSRAVARFGQLTARRKAAEEKLQKMEQEITQLKQSNAKKVPVVKDNPLKDITEPKVLREKHDSATQVIDWAQDLLFENEDYGPSDVITTVDGKEMTKSEVRKALKRSQDIITKYVPAQVAELKKRTDRQVQTQQFQRKVMTEFDWVKDPKNPATQRYKKMLSDKRLQGIDKTNPELASQMPYILAHAANSLYNRTPVEPGKTPPLTPPKSTSSAARAEQKAPRTVKNVQEAQKRFNNSGSINDFIALRTQQKS
jgi:hypothetical protein